MYSISSAPPLSYPGLLRWTKTVLRIYGLRLNDRFGQNFVVKPQIIIDSIDCLLSYSCSRILELGAGLGSLSYYLNAICGSTLSVEIDSKLAEIAYRVVENVRGSIVNGNGLDFISTGLFHQFVSNTPYYLSGRIVAKLASSNTIHSASLLLQKEVGDRLLARPGEPDYGRLSIIGQLFFEAKVKRVYPPSFFYPRPEVSGELVCLRRKKAWDEKIHGNLEELTACLFSGRNRMAYKQASKCTGLPVNEVSWLTGKRVREMTPWEIERLLEISS
ncbi:MAG: rRNA adenine N(6)-methyltransferase family protein [Desulfurococcales archaeon]|nr:rRNA adenine N(6)-methyltransferase family protein [Desulfurococcales archaeon]